MPALHSPRLDTIQMVEQTIQKLDYPARMELWRALPRKVMYQTFMTIIDYLHESNKILIDSDGRIVWTWNPEHVRDLIRRGLVLK